MGTWPAASEFKENSLCREPGVQDKWHRHVDKRSTDHPLQQRYAILDPGKVKGQNSMGIVEGSCGYRTRVFTIRDNSLYQET